MKALFCKWRGSAIPARMISPTNARPLDAFRWRLARDVPSGALDRPASLHSVGQAHQGHIEAPIIVLQVARCVDSVL